MFAFLKHPFRKACLLLACAVFFVVSTACDRTGSKLQEKAPPNPLIAKKNKPVQGASLAAKKKLLYKSASFQLSDAANWLGGFRFQATSVYRFKRRSKVLRLKETYKISQRTSGDFRTYLKNSKGRGYEVVWAEHKLYVRFFPKAFRMMSKDIHHAYRWQRRGYGQWRALVGLFGPHMVLKSEGAVSLLSRSCIRYRIGFSSTPDSSRFEKEGSAWGGVVPNRTRGAASKLPRVPKSGKGRLWIDQQTGLVMKVVFEGSYKIGGKATAKVSLKAAFVSRGNPNIVIPTKVLRLKREPDALNPFAHRKPSYFQDPPQKRKKRKKRRR